MTSVGQQLRNERERKGLALAQIAAQTRISERYLVAIEADDLSKLPGGFFYRSFVRQYAGALGLDHQELEDQLDRVMPAPPPVIPNDSGQPAPPPIRELHPILSEAHSSVGDRRPIGLQIGMLVLVIAACAGLYAWWDSMQKSNATPPTETPAATTPAPQEKPPASSAPPASPAPAPAPPTVATAETPALPQAPPAVLPAAPPPAIAGALTLRLSATEDVWVSVNSDGKVLFSGILQPSEAKVFEAHQTANLLIGNAGGLDVQWNGKPLGPIGPRGQVRKVVLTPEKFEIIDPRKLVPDKPVVPGVGL